MTDPCLLRNDYLGGRLAEPDAQRFETHASTCDACDAALLADDLGLGDELGLAALADVTCPPELLTSVLPASRRAPDRPSAARSAARRRRGRLWVAPTALAVAAVAVFLLMPHDTADPLASAGDPTETVDPDPTRPEPSGDGTEAEGVAQDAPLVASAEAAPTVTAPPRPTPSRAPARPTRSDSAPIQVAEDAPPADPDPTPEEIEAAARDLALAFAIIDDVQSRAGRTVRKEVADLSSTFDYAIPH